MERDYQAILRGVSVEYGSQAKTYASVAESMGVPRARKRRAEGNDGRAPDTTDALLQTGRSVGRPRGAVNIDRNPFTTYPSYHAADAKKPELQNQCWLAAGLETLYALFSPLWTEGSKGGPNNLYTILVKHFTSRTTYDLNSSGQIRSILTRGQNKLAKHLELASPGSFRPGAFASTDLFIEIVLDPARNNAACLKTLFNVTQHRTLYCDALPDEHHQRETRERYILTINRERFDYAEIPHDDISRLLELWSTEGLIGHSGRVCRQCQPATTCAAPNREGEESSEAGSVEVVTGVTSQPAYMYEHTVLDFQRPPPHLYFYVEATEITVDSTRSKFMGEMNWPATITIGGVVYRLISRGFWHFSHYWCKVVWTPIGGVTGVWLHDDRQNGGIAQLVDQNIDSIGGPMEYTSWLFYSRTLNLHEDQVVSQSVEQIKKDNPNYTGDIPFSHLLSKISQSANLKPFADAAASINTPGHAVLNHSLLNFTNSAFKSGAMNLDQYDAMNLDPESEYEFKSEDFDYNAGADTRNAMPADLQDMDAEGKTNYESSQVKQKTVLSSFKLPNPPKIASHPAYKEPKTNDGV